MIELSSAMRKTLRHRAVTMAASLIPVGYSSPSSLVLEGSSFLLPAWETAVGCLARMLSVFSLSAADVVISGCLETFSVASVEEPASMSVLSPELETFSSSDMLLELGATVGACDSAVSPSVAGLSSELLAMVQFPMCVECCLSFGV